MRELEFPGTYRDAHGTEALTWRLYPVPGYKTPHGPGPGAFEFSCRVRGIQLRSRYLEDLEIDPEDRPAALTAGLTLRDGLTVTACVLTGQMPLAVSTNGIRRTVPLAFELDQHHIPSRPHIVTLHLPTPAGTYEVTEASFEDGLERIHAALDNSVELDCCLKCKWSAYLMFSQMTIGMSCNRDAPHEHLAAHTKGEIANVPRTEIIPETYLCDIFERKASLRRDRIGGVTFHPANATNNTNATNATNDK